MTFFDVFSQSDTVGKTVALLLLAMSICSWVLIIYKTIQLWGAPKRVKLAIASYWAAQDLAQAHEHLQLLDKRRWLHTLAQVTNAQTPHAPQHVTRLLRQALQDTRAHLEFGMTALATIGSTAPFVGLLGTVWGIYHALTSIAQGGQVSIDKIAAPVGEALIMTAVGLAVAIPAVLAYNLFGRRISLIEEQLQGFAHDLRENAKPPNAQSSSVN